MAGNALQGKGEEMLFSYKNNRKYWQLGGVKSYQVLLISYLKVPLACV